MSADPIEELRRALASRDLDASVPPRIARTTLAGAKLEWTAASATAHTDPETGLPKLCVTTGNYNASVTPAPTHARCAP